MKHAYQQMTDFDLREQNYNCQSYKKAFQNEKKIAKKKIFLVT